MTTPYQPENYRVRIEPDLKHFTFSGSVDIQLNAFEPIREITLNLLEIAIWSCRLRSGDSWTDCPFMVDRASEEIRIYLLEAISGPIELSIAYQGIINDKMAGFYRSRYEQAGQTRHIAVTQFQESDARRAFPCMDHPARKATFDIELTVDDTLSAIANTPVVSEESLENGKKRVTFAQTPRMSTYLVFFGVGEFEMIQDASDPRVRLFALPGMSDQGKLGLDFGRKALRYCEAYYRVPYPLPKLDMIAVPDFAFGAMENWGAMTFRENLLLHDPQVTSRSGEQRICEVIAHEIAHQWFGNLVTPADWKYLWLNESFATFFGFGVVDHYYPEWETWGEFLHSMTASAMERDGLQETFPIEIPGGEHVVINAATAPIIYNKGGSILRQLKGYIGEEAFQSGLTHYLEEHAYDNAMSHHLWEAFEAASHLPVVSMIQSWIEQPGYPIVEARRDGSRLILSQKRFTYLASPSDQIWQIPVSVTVFTPSGQENPHAILLDSRQEEIDLGADAAAYKINTDQTGFFRVKYTDTDNLAALGRHVQSREISALDRWGLENDLYALMKGGDATAESYLDFLSNYTTETDFLPLLSIAGNLYSAYLIAGESGKARIARIGRSIFENCLDLIGLEPTAEESHAVSILRDRILWQTLQYGSEKVANFTYRSFQSLQQEETVHPDIMRVAMMTGARMGGETAFNWLDGRFRSSAHEHERMNILQALGCFRYPNLIAAALQYVLEQVPNRNQFVPLVTMAANPDAIPLLWDWYLKNLKAVEQFHPILYERVIAAMVPVCGLDRPEAVREFFNEYVNEKPAMRDVVSLSLERLEINLRLRTALNSIVL